MSGCGATCGIQRVRERERASALAAIARAYPDFVWREEPEASLAVFDLDRIASLAPELEALLPVRAIVRAGGGQGCDALYLLAGLRPTSLVELADGAPRIGSPPPRETYLRLAFSPIGRYVALHEVVVTATSLDDGAIEIVEEPCVGVSDLRLKDLVKGLQGKLRSLRLVLLDVAFLVEPPPPVGGLVADAPEASTLWSFLFEPAPLATRRFTLISPP